MKKINLSVALAVYNEEKNLEACLKSIQDIAGEIIVVDGGSVDKTVQIAEKYKAKVIKTSNPPMFHINKQKALDACQGKWILQLDADEIVTEKLKEEIKKIIGQKKQAVSGYYLPRKNYLLGKWLQKGGAYPDCVIRFFKKDKGEFPLESVHEQIRIKGKTGYLKNDLIHLPYPTFSEYIRKANTYTSLTAEKMKENKIKLDFLTSLKYLFIKPLATFFNLFFKHKGFLDGLPGFVWAFFSALHHSIAYIKYRKQERSAEKTPGHRQRGFS